MPRKRPREKKKRTEPHEQRGAAPRGRVEPVRIRRLPTGVPGFDEIVGAGGIPEYSFNIIAGAPGSGKTTLAHQFVFANATTRTPAIYFTLLGEPAVKMLRYQQQFTFFDQSRIDGAIRFINLSDAVLNRSLDEVLEEIVEQVEQFEAKIVVVDSFRTVVRTVEANAGELGLQEFVQRLALHLASLHATSFLVGEYTDQEIRDNPVFTVADAIIWLYQVAERNSVVRKLQVMKLRGQEHVPGLHFFRITNAGLLCFPRTFGLSNEAPFVNGERRLSTGIPKLDRIMSGGIPEGDSILVAGPSGSGKSILGAHFIEDGLARGEPGIIAVFEETPAAYIRRAKTLGFDLERHRRDGTLEVIYLRPLDLSVDETVYEIVSAVHRVGAKRVVIDSLVGFEMALAPGFRTDFRESLYRMIGALTRQGATILSTVEIEDEFTSFDFSKYVVSFLADDILRMRYVSIAGQLRKMLTIVKMRSSPHSIDLWEYAIGNGGIEVGQPFRGYQGVTSGIPGPWSPSMGRTEMDPSPWALGNTAAAPPRKKKAARTKSGRKRGP